MRITQLKTPLLIKSSLVFSLLCVFAITSCEQEDINEEIAAEELVESPYTIDFITEDTEEDYQEAFGSEKAGAWQNKFWDPFNSFNGNKWSKTNRNDYNSSRCRYQSSQVFTASHNGDNFLVLKAEKNGNNGWKSGHVKSKANWDPRNGRELRFRARIKFNSFNNNGSWRPFNQSVGAWPAFWTVNENGWPTKGEIDIMEGYTFGNSSNDRYASNMFYGRNSGRSDLRTSQTEKRYSGSVSNSGWVTYEMRWRQNNRGWNVVEVYVNGDRKKTYHNNNVDNLRLQNFVDHNVILNLNIGSDGNIFDGFTPNVHRNTDMLVDWVSIQERTR